MADTEEEIVRVSENEDKEKDMEKYEDIQMSEENTIQKNEKNKKEKEELGAEESDGQGMQTSSTEDIHTDVQAMSTREYLDTLVTPFLIQAMKEVAKVRPDKPLQFVAHMLLTQQSEKMTQNDDKEPNNINTPA